MEARYPGTCGRCGQHFPAGTVIKKEGRRWSHGFCPPAGDPRNTPSVPVPSFTEHDYQTIGWIGELLIEQGSPEAAWLEYCAMNEWWDGEREIEDAARRRFEHLLPYAQAQNREIHPRMAGATDV